MEFAVFRLWFSGFSHRCLFDLEGFYLFDGGGGDFVAADQVNLVYPFMQLKHRVGFNFRLLLED